MSGVFADTSGLFAYVTANDRAHPAARRILDGLLDEERVLHSSSYVLLETTSLLQSRVGLEAALAFDREVRRVLRVRWIDESLHAKSVQRLRARASRRVSLVDCSSFVVMEEEGLTEAFAFDPHFEHEGFRLVTPRR